MKIRKKVIMIIAIIIVLLLMLLFIKLQKDCFDNITGQDGASIYKDRTNANDSAVYNNIIEDNERAYNSGEKSNECGNEEFAQEIEITKNELRNMALEQ